MSNNNNNNNQKRNNDPISFEILERIKVLSSKENGWTKEVNVVAWNGGAAKIDLREWDPEHVRMTKGITLFDDEAEKLTMALAGRYNVGGSAPAQESSAGSVAAI